MAIIPGFSNRLGVAIARSGKKKGDVARAAKLEPRSLSRYLKGDRVPHETVLMALAQQLGVSVDYLLGRAENPSIPTSSTVVSEPPGVYTPDAVSLVGLGEDERRTVLRMLDALRSGQADVHQHLIGQLKIIELVVQSRRKLPRPKEGNGS